MNSTFKQIIAGICMLFLWTSANASWGQNRDVTFKIIRNLIHRQQIRSISQLIQNLPTELKSNAVLLRSSQSPQQASDRFPRVILYTNDGKLMISFNGHPEQRGYERLEIIQFRDASFEFKEIQFFEKDGKLPLIHEQPTTCASCHGLKSPRPLWEPYYLWPDAYGSVRDSISRNSKEEESFLQFLKSQRSHERYGPVLQNFAFKRVQGAYFSKNSRQLSRVPNLRLYFLLNALNFERIANLLKSSDDFAHFQFAIYGALLNCDKLEQFIPPDLLSIFFRPLEYFLQDTIDKNRRASHDRYHSFKKLRSTNYDKQDTPLHEEDSLFELRENLEIISKLRFILENREIITDTWSLSHSRSAYAFDPRPTVNLKAIIHFFEEPLRNLGVPVVNKKQGVIAQTTFFFGEYGRFFAPSPAADLFSYQVPEQETSKACQLLKQKSIETLRTLSIPRFGSNPSSSTCKASHAPLSRLLQICDGCHSEKNQTGPFIPFGNKDRLATFIEKNKGLKPKIIERLTSSDEPMPPSQELEPSERDLLEKYFRSLSTQ